MAGRAAMDRGWWERTSRREGLEGIGGVQSTGGSVFAVVAARDHVRFAITYHI